MTTGYQCSHFAGALSSIGAPLELSLSGGWLLRRSIAGTEFSDAMGCYPLFSCSDWSRLEDDLRALRGVVSVSMVSDPFGNHTPELLRNCFPDVMIPFKEHYVVDLSQDLKTTISEHHQRGIDTALRHLVTEQCEDPQDFATDFIALYRNLIRRRSITGIAAFSPSSLACQLAVPGACLFRASLDGATVGLLLWMIHNGVAFAHLAGYSQAGYTHHASYALMDRSLAWLQEHGIEWADLGGMPGVYGAAADPGMTAYKAGWSTGMRTAYFCGRVLDNQAYQALADRFGRADGGYFPAYRRPSEFQSGEPAGKSA